mmetsp:Transcript_13559/g.29011  ORF Transcript_13559/g.29011 Transcript_13559/m.29011 type:complete len:217 (-) Transcript_13559:924-1574(-)
MGVIVAIVVPVAVARVAMEEVPAGVAVVAVVKGGVPEGAVGTGEEDLVVALAALLPRTMPKVLWPQLTTATPLLMLRATVAWIHLLRMPMRAVQQHPTAHLGALLHLQRVLPPLQLALGEQARRRWRKSLRRGRFLHLHLYRRNLHLRHLHPHLPLHLLFQPLLLHHQQSPQRTSFQHCSQPLQNCPKLLLQSLLSQLQHQSTSPLLGTQMLPRPC